MYIAHQFGILDYHILEDIPASMFVDWLRFFGAIKEAVRLPRPVSPPVARDARKAHLVAVVESNMAKLK